MINAAKGCGRWTLLENKFTMTAEERHESNARGRRKTQSRPARYVNGVRLSDEEVANITQHKSQEKINVKRRKNEAFWTAAAAPQSAPRTTSCLAQSCGNMQALESTIQNILMD